EVSRMQNGGPDRRPPLRPLHLAVELGPSRVRNRRARLHHSARRGLGGAAPHLHQSPDAISLGAALPALRKRIPERTPAERISAPTTSYTIITCTPCFLSLEPWLWFFCSQYSHSDSNQASPPRARARNPRSSRKCNPIWALSLMAS